MDFYSLEFEYCALGLNAKQVESWNIPTRQPKRKSSNDKLWPYSFAAELDAILVTKLSNHLKKNLRSIFLTRSENVSLIRIRHREPDFAGLYTTSKMNNAILFN